MPADDRLGPGFLSLPAGAPELRFELFPGENILLRVPERESVREGG